MAHVEPDGTITRLGQQAVDVVVVVGWVVVEEDQLADPRLMGHLDGVVHRAVSPVGTLGEFLRGELGIVDQQVHAVSQGQHLVVDTSRIVDGLLVVADVGHAQAVPVDPVPEGPADVGHRSGGHPCRSDVEASLRSIVERHPPGQLPVADWKEGGRHEHVKRLLERAALLARSEHVEPGVRAVQRSKEGKPLDVVPMEMADQRGGPEGAGPATLVHAVEPKAGTQIEDDRLTTRDVEHHTRGVPPVPPVGIARARGGTPDSEERDVE